MSSPFHPGELAAQRLAGGGSPGGGIRDAMPEQHRRFFAALPYIAVATTDGGGPITTLLTGRPGFVSAPDATTLRIAAPLDERDPASRALLPGAPVGVLGIDLATRRRNRANGVVTSSGTGGFEVAVQQSFGNCPQYIQLRDVQVVPRAKGPAETLPTLDHAARALIERADTFFVASAARTDEPAGGVDVSHRGGRPGFVRIDGDVLTIPDFRGNRYFNTLGNLLSDPRAALLFVDFDGGALLQLQGTTEIVWDGPEVDSFEGAERLWRFRTARLWRRAGAVALGWKLRELAPTTVETGVWRR